MIAVKHGSRLVSGDLHGNAFRDPNIHHIADGGTPKSWRTILPIPYLIFLARPLWLAFSRSWMPAFYSLLILRDRFNRL